MHLDAVVNWPAWLRLIAATFAMLILVELATGGELVAEEPDAPDKEFDEAGPETLLLPFPFFNESFGAAAGVVFGVSGYPERQSRLIGAVLGGTRGSGMLFFAGTDVRTPLSDRLFVDPVFSAGYFQDTESYVDGNPRFSGQRAGSNTSNDDNFVSGNGFDNFARVRFKYLLPIGDGRHHIIPDFELDRGILVSGATGGTSLLPWESGRTFASVRPFYRNQQIDTDDLEEDEFKSNGLDAALLWDNRDFFINPSRGQGVRFEVSQDFGVLGSDSSWTVLEGEVDHYINLGASDWFRQQVLALDFWTAHSPSWNESPSGEIRNRPPAYAGATLGGLWRMRGFPSQRFSDASAIYYAAELRLIPDWNPFNRWSWARENIGVEWLQFVPFVEVGRVAPEYDLANLHSSMKWDVGLGLRAFAKGFVIRADAAYSEESVGLQMMVSQPFQF